MTGMDELSRQCLLGRQVPPALERLWKASQEGDTFLLDNLAMTLLTSRDVLDDWHEQARDSDPDVKTGGQAYLRIFERLAVFAQCEDGEIIAFDVETGSEDDPPILQIDSDGEFSWLGTSFGEGLLRIGEFCETEEETAEWLLQQGIPFRTLGKLGSTTGHYRDFDDLLAQYQFELLGKPRPNPGPRTQPAVATDVWTWLGRPGAEVLTAMRALMSLPADGFPDDEWITCDGQGNVMQSFTHPIGGVTVNGVPHGASRSAVLQAFGEPSQAFENGNLRFDRGGYYARFGMEGDVVDSMFVGRCD